MQRLSNRAHAGREEAERVHRLQCDSERVRRDRGAVRVQDVWWVRTGEHSSCTCHGVWQSVVYAQFVHSALI